MIVNIIIVMLIAIIIMVKFVTVSHISVKAAEIGTAEGSAGIEELIVSASEATLLTPQTHDIYAQQGQNRQHATQIHELPQAVHSDSASKRNVNISKNTLKKKFKKKSSNVDLNVNRNLYRIVQTSANCTRDMFQIDMELNRPFHGVVYAKDFNYDECRSRGTSEKNVSLKLPTSGCGVRVESHSHDTTMELTIHIMIQIEEKLRQSTDLLKTIRCILPQSAMGLTLTTTTATTSSWRTSKMRAGFRNGRTQHKSYSATIPDLNEDNENNNNSNNSNNKKNRKNYNENNNIKMHIYDHNNKKNDFDMVTISTTAKTTFTLTKEQQKKRQHLGNSNDNGNGNSVHQTSNQRHEHNSSTPRVRIWLELGGPDGSGSVMVGQATILTVHAIVPGNIGVRIVDCAALDGLGESTQQLLDDRGCPIDEQVMPALQMDYRPAEEGWSKQDDDELLERTCTAMFPAFKFPDRERLHVSCGVQLCKAQCPNVNCETENLLELSNDKHLARIDVFNSLAVTAPQIEMDRLRYDPFYNMTVIDYPSHLRHLLNDGILCLSVSKLAISFCILGLIFLTAVIVAILSLIRSRRRFIHYRGSSSSGGGGVGTIGCGSGSSNALMSTTNNGNRLLHRTEVCTSMFSSSSDSSQSPIRFGSKLFIPYYPNTFPYERVKLSTIKTDFNLFLIMFNF